MSTGLLDHLVRRYPRARFTVVCGPVAAGLFARLPRLERVIVLEKRRFDLHWLALWGKLGVTPWSLVVDLRGSAVSFALLAGRRAVMRGGRRAGHRLGHIGGVLGLDPPPLPVVWTAPADEARAAGLVPDGGPVIGLGPTANWAGKVWPAERFVSLFSELARVAPGARAAVFGGAGDQERAMALPVLAALPGAIDLVGVLSLAEAACCLRRCVLFAGNDSGLMHLAAAAGTPTLGLFGPSLASEYAPSGRCTAFAVAEGPVGRAPMDGLSVQVALRVAIGLLEMAASGLEGAA